MAALVLEIVVDDKGTPVLRQFSGEVQKVSQAIDSGTTAPLQQATKASASFNSSLAHVLRSGAGFALGFAGVQTVGSLFASAAESAASFEAALANVNTLGIKSIATQQMLRQQVLQLPPALGSSTELARGLYEVLSSGVEPAQAVAFLEQSARLARAGLADLDVTTTALTKTINAYNIPVEKAAEVSDILFKTVEIGQGSLSQFAGAFPQVTQIAAALGISLLDTANAMATLTQTFRNADTAATGLRSLLSQLLQNSDQLLALGINIRQVISEEGLLGVVRVLQQVSQGSSERLRGLINDVEGFNAALALTGPQYQTLLANQQKFVESTGVVAGALQEQTKTSTAAWAEFTNSLDRLLQEASPPVLGFFTKLVNAGTFSIKEIAALFKGELSPVVVRQIDELTAAEDALEIWNNAAIKTTATVKETARQTVLAKNAQEAYNKVFDDANAAALGLAEGLKKLRDEAGAAIPARELETRINAVIKNLDAMRLSGVFSARQILDAYDRTAKDLEAIFGELPPAFKERFDQVLREAEGTSAGLRRAFQEFGLRTREQLQETATQALTAFRQILDSGQATPQQLLEQWQRILTQLTEAGFQQLPPEWQAVNTRMQEIARRAGDELPRPFRDAFGQIVVDAQKPASAFEQTFNEVFTQVTEAQIQFGNRFREHLDAGTRRAAEQFRLIGLGFVDLQEGAAETGAAIEEGIGGGSERARDRALTALDETAKAAKQVRIVFEERFPTTVEGLIERLRQAQQELAHVPFLSEIGASGFREFTRERIQDTIDILLQKLRDLGVDQFGRPLTGAGSRGGSGATGTTPTGQQPGAPTGSRPTGTRPTGGGGGGSRPGIGGTPLPIFGDAPMPGFHLEYIDGVPLLVPDQQPTTAPPVVSIPLHGRPPTSPENPQRPSGNTPPFVLLAPSPSQPVSVLPRPAPIERPRITGGGPQEPQFPLGGGGGSGGGGGGSIGGTLGGVTDFGPNTDITGITRGGRRELVINFNSALTTRAAIQEAKRELIPVIEQMQREGIL